MIAPDLRREPDRESTLDDLSRREPPIQIAPPGRGVPLGWRLALYLSLTVTVVMGGVTLPQRFRDIRAHRQEYKSALQEALVPLAASIESAGRPEESRKAIDAFHRAYLDQGHLDHQLVLRDARNNVIVSTLPGNRPPAPHHFQASVPVASEAIPGGEGTLTVVEDGAMFYQAVRRQWVAWGRHMAITVAAILLFVLPAVRYLVTRPLELLLDEIGRMEKGYFSQRLPRKGAWEVRFVAWRFQNLAMEVQNTVERLMTAERRAQTAVQAAARQDASSGLLPLLERLPRTSPAVPDLLLESCVKLEAMNPGMAGAERAAQEMLSNQAVEADRMGLRALKARIENAALTILQPAKFQELDARLKDMRGQYDEWVQGIRERLRKLLSAHRLPFWDIQFRFKHTAGVLRKMQAQNLDIDDLNDIFAFRLIVATEADCYWALGLVHQTFQPVISRFKDYIAHPKANSYQSLHTSVRDVEGTPFFEVQIRSVAMHRYAEQGDAAHWTYKKEQPLPAASKGALRTLWNRMRSNVSERLRRTEAGKGS